MSHIFNHPDFQKLQFKFYTHQNKKVILLIFPYNPTFHNELKIYLKSMKWSRTLNAWYVPNNTLYRNLLNIPHPQIGDNYIPKLFEINKNEFVKFRNVLYLKAYSHNTIATYLTEFAQLLLLLKNYPVYNLTANRINDYLLYCIHKEKLSEALIHSRINAIKAYFKYVQNSSIQLQTIVRPKKIKQLPKVFSKPDLNRIFNATLNIKHELLLKLVYGMGLRVSEIVRLKIEHVDLQRLSVLIVNAKGKKDRYVNFPTTVTNLYNDYLKLYQPHIYLFNGPQNSQYSVRSAQNVFKNALNRAKIYRNVGIHSLRHSFATHLLEAGVDIVFIQKLMGHKNVKTTEIYAQITSKQLANIQSPLDDF